MEGERILKSLLNGETDGLFEDTKNYLAPLRTPLKSKNGCKVGSKLAEETVSKYTVFVTKFLRCAIETLKKVKAKGDSLDEVTKSLNLVGTLLNDTLSVQNGTYLKFIASLDQLGKTLYLIVVQLIAKTQFDKALCHANHLLKFIQLLKSWKNYDSNKMDKELSSLAKRMSDALLQGAGKLEEVKVTPVQRAAHLCVILDWRKLSLLFQAEAITNSSLECVVDRTLKCGTKYQIDCGQKNVNFKVLASFFESVFEVLIVKTEQLITNGKDSLLVLVELGFHYGRICGKAERSTQALNVFDKLLEIARKTNHSKNGQSKLHQIPSQVCCCVCLVCKATIFLNCSANATPQTEDSYQQMLSEGNQLVSQLLKYKTLSSSVLRLLSDSMEYFRSTLQNAYNSQTDFSRRTFQDAVQLLKLYAAVLSLQCELIKTVLHKANATDDVIVQSKQQLQKTTVRQLTALNFVISSYQDQMKSEKVTEECSKDSRSLILRDCIIVAQQASTLMHSALDDPDIPLSTNELRWLGSSVYNLGCVAYRRGCFSEGEPLLAIACEDLKIWSFAAETEQGIVARTEEVKLLTKYSLLTDCQRRARQLSGALKTATAQVLIALRTSCDADILSQQIKQWTSVKHELVKNLQNEEKMPERSRTLCSAFAELEDAKDVVGNQLCLVLQEELACYKAKSYDTAVEQVSVIKQLTELFIVQEDEFQYGSAMLDLAIALDSLVDVDLGEDKSALEYCQEAVSILEQLSDRATDEDDEENFPSSFIQDRLAVAYLWLALLEHKSGMEAAATSPEFSESFEAEEMEVVHLEQPFVSSLYLALDTWTVLVSKSTCQDTNREIKLQHFANPEETCHYLLVTAAMFGLLNKPFKRVCALYLAGSISQAIVTNDMLDSALCAFSDAIHSLCDMLDISHAFLLMHRASNLVEAFEPSSTSKAQFLLAKSHYLLLTGKCSDGEDCLEEVLQSEVLTRKNYMSHLLKARLKSICAKYSMLPAKLHKVTITLDPLLGSLTALECALDGYHKLSQMAEDIFGSCMFCSGKQKQKENKTVEGHVSSTGSSQNIFNLSLLQDLLSSLLQVGQLYAHQGAVREAFRQFVDGIALARQFSLSYRIAEFLTNIAQLEVMQGKVDKCQHWLDQLKAMLQPVLKQPSKLKLSSVGVQEPLFTEHPDMCECVSCLDPALHVIIVNYFANLSSYFESVSSPEQAIQALEVGESVCRHAEDKMTRTLKRLGIVLCGAEPSDCSSKTTKKKRGANSRKQKGDSTLTSTSTSQLMFSQYYATLFCMNANLLLQNGKVEKANVVLSGAMENLHNAEDTYGNRLIHLFPIKASLLYMHGVVTLLHNKGSSGDILVDSNWFSKSEIQSISKGNTKEVRDSMHAEAVEQAELEMPRRGSSRRCRTSKSVEDNGKKKPSRAKRRGKSKKVEEIPSDDNESDADVQQKPKGQSKQLKTAKVASFNKMNNEIQAPKWLDQAIQYFNEAFELCQVCPSPALFSSICRGLAFCHGRSAPKLSMYYLNMSTSVTLRHKAVTRTGKRIRRTAKDMSLSFPMEHYRDMTQLAEDLSNLSLNNMLATGLTAEAQCKLAQLVKTRNIMKFILPNNGTGQSSSPFCPEEISLLENIPKEWTVCTLETFTPPGSQARELIICRIRAGFDPVVVKINTTLGEEQNKEDASDEVVMDLTKLFQCSVMEEFNDIMSDSVKSMGINNTSEWWALRTSLDVRMKNLLAKLESSWLGRWKGVVLGQPVDKDYCDATVSIARQLQEKIIHLYGYKADEQLLEVLVSSSPHLSRKQATEAFVEITGLDSTASSLNELLDEFEELTGNLFQNGNKKSGTSRSGKKIDDSSAAETVSRNPVILILGKDIQHLPWESIPMLFDQPVTRVPSLQFLLSKVSCRSQFPQVDPVRTFYALNPQNNLLNTQKMFEKWFESENGWHGITGKAPTQQQFSSALTDHELFIYFGHGTGREFLQGDDIQRLDCRAVTLLMGCSSGKLTVGGECEPRGMALNYLLAGCPAIVANLWDVTDKDIDRFSESLLKQWLQPDAQLSLPQVLSQSRQACKLKYLIGASPVLYGLPAHIKQ